MEIEELVNKLNECRESYYNKGVSLMSDEEFDFEEKRLRELDPQNPYFQQIGRKTSTRDIPVEHKIPMLSMQKVQTAEDAEAWINSVAKGDVWVDPKLDGISGKVVFNEEGLFDYASTRGDGTVGALIPFAKDISGVPKRFLANSELRGEFIINKKHQHLYGPLRNTCSGLLKRKDKPADIANVSFVIYDVHCYKKENELTFINRGEKLSKIERILKDLGEDYNIVTLRKTGDIYKAYDDYVNSWRESYPYETDGMILTVDGGQDVYDQINSKYKITTFNRFNMALKPPAESASSTVRSIDVAVNRMKVSFVAVFDPILINGVKIERATLDNYSSMRAAKIGVGTKVLVKRSNDVIPKIIEAYNDEDVVPFDIERCPCCGSKLEMNHQDVACTNEYGCPGVYASKLQYLLKSIGVKNVGDATINSIATLFDDTDFALKFSIFFATLRDPSQMLAYLFKSPDSKSAQRFMDSIRIAFEDPEFTEVSVMGSFSIPTIGKTELINHNIKTLAEMEEYVKFLDTIQYTSSFDTELKNWWNDEKHVEDLRETMELLKPYFHEEAKESGDEITYCISGDVPGFTKSKLAVHLAEIDPRLKFVSSVKMGLDFLISNEEGTTKVLKAKKYGIPVYTLDETLSKFQR